MTLEDDDAQSELSSLTTLTPSEPHSDLQSLTTNLRTTLHRKTLLPTKTLSLKPSLYQSHPRLSKNLNSKPNPNPSPLLHDDGGYQPSTSPNRYRLAEELTPEQLEEMEGGGQPDQPGPDPQQFNQLMQQFFMNMMQRVQQQPMPQGGGHAAPHQPRVPLPYPDEKGAPRFDGDEYKIGMFLDSFETRARLAGVAEEQWKKKGERETLNF
ncbi:hypothetical protein AURDEDRAFT_177624 [Auricularia subglabra TFB-10046 SS5]|uniref:Uncharacterized protein n=1 Tax=Auricularia subglabra (strain TFB-10046 / SS5) TaxID=717982 RepID=J0CSN4_AURST|nr:hypothetical protein AURDEDRAFT_177624 [Auricularia subglabra TFB-10046 SS5]